MTAFSGWPSTSSITPPSPAPSALTPADRDDLIAEVFAGIVEGDYAVLRHFRGESSLATYLTVIARRIVVRELLKHRSLATLSDAAGRSTATAIAPRSSSELPTGTRSRNCLSELDGKEAEAVRMYHLESKSYAEIGAAIHMPENSIGPLLSRARTKLHRAGVDSAAACQACQLGWPIVQQCSICRWTSQQSAPARWRMTKLVTLCCVGFVWQRSFVADDDPPAKRVEAADGLSVQRVAAPPLVRFPMFATFDDSRAALRRRIVRSRSLRGAQGPNSQVPRHSP